MTIRKSRGLVAPLILAFFALAIVTTPTAGAAPACFGRKPTKVGTRTADVINGTKGSDVIVGLGGADQIDGRGGNDFICGGGGVDTILGSDGNDRVDGGGGDDTIFGEAGNDVLRLGKGLNAAVGGPGDDRIIGGNSLDLAAYIDAPGPVEVDLGEGTASGNGRDVLIKVDGALGSDANDSLRGSSGTNILFGGGGDDSIFTGGNTGTLDTPRTNSADIAIGDGDPQAPPGDDTLTGGAGLNILDYSSSQTGVQVDLALGKATGDGVDTISGFQFVFGTDSNDSFIGDQNDNAFGPLNGDDDVSGGAGVDTLVFAAADGVVADIAAGSATGEGTDTFGAIENIWGSIGADTFTGDGGPNEIYGFTGNDGIGGAAGDDLLDGGDGVDSLDGGDGTDTCKAGESATNCEGSQTRVWSPTALVSRGPADLIQRLIARLPGF